jgi:hypothetical protein
VAEILEQIIDYIQLNLKEVPDDPTCTQLLQQWHVPRRDETRAKGEKAWKRQYIERTHP